MLKGDILSTQSPTERFVLLRFLSQVFVLSNEVSERLPLDIGSRY